MNKLAVLACAAMLLALTLGCGKSSTKPTVDSGGAQHETDLGSQALASGNYANANAHFKAAIALDPGNAQAQFGAGVTEVYLLQNDPDILAVQAQLPLVRSPIVPVQHSRTGRVETMRQRLTAARSGVDQRYSPKPMGTAFFRTLLLAADEPDSISEVQAIIRNKVMPRLQYAEERLNAAEAASNFVMLLPPSVTDLPDTIEIDKTELYVLDAVVNSVQGWCGLLVAYNFDVENSDFEHVNAESLLTGATAWATLHAGGVLDLASARLNFLNVKGKLDAAAAYLAAETDDQSDDIIPQSWLTTQDFTDLHDAVAQVYTSLNSPVTITVNDYSMQPMDLQIQIGRFFVPAITDLKPKFPALVFYGTVPEIAVPITFPDPTINGIFPDMTNVRWRQLTGITAASRLAPRAVALH